MENIVYKFLDKFVGSEVKAVQIKLNTYKLISNYGVRIIDFQHIRENEMVIWSSRELRHVVATYFSITEFEATNHIKIWLGKKYKLNKGSDLKKFITTSV